MFNLLVQRYQDVKSHKGNVDKYKQTLNVYFRSSESVKILPVYTHTYAYALIMYSIYLSNNLNRKIQTETMDSELFSHRSKSDIGSLISS